mmetsp:Transcript_35916/g.49845  ORF Transcript_35916/g.49845 Transcript_35916/m.49845 type:complete len:322 (+) Transcript_35916:78-1043(+)|eukprot:CAMPEP_0196583408 /NCGR_PEP_ID=MMETSP1081-20130531/43496_1 /TAXON_ID=36882 /ORGANISM="Pyramimonas amylifera, Strain CCMP720" /LENGTH=321 /DNA_ID=CAMNT_0041904295 /DNA_START=76 /DNA_END=1041 /DNA_ORIENTATION=+
MRSMLYESTCSLKNVPKFQSKLKTQKFGTSFASLFANNKNIQRAQIVFHCHNSGDGKDPSEVKTGAGLKAVWYGAEQFGKLVGLSKKVQGGAGQQSEGRPSRSAGGQVEREAAVAALRADYEENYFVSGAGKMDAYDPNCVFSDPFVSFAGVQRFKDNVSNLGGLMEDIDLDITSWEESESEVVTSWRFSCILQLPHRPKLAAAGGTTHVFDESSGRVIKHIERWDVDPGTVVKQLLKPAARFPTSKAEVLMMSVSEGDAKGVWFEVSPYFLQYSVGLVALSTILSLFTGDNTSSFLDVSLYTVVFASGLTECIKFFGQLT